MRPSERESDRHRARERELEGMRDTEREKELSIERYQ